MREQMFLNEKWLSQSEQKLNKTFYNKWLYDLFSYD